MRAFTATALVVAASLPFVAYMGFKPGIDAHVVMGVITISEHDADARYDALARTASVDVQGNLRVVDVRGLIVRSYLVSKPCASIVLTGNSWLDRTVVTLGDASGEVTYPFGSQLLGRVNPGAPYAVVTEAAASNALGSAAAECEDFQAIPDAPRPGAPRQGERTSLMAPGLLGVP